MGRAMAGRFIAAGHAVCGYDRREEACREAAALGVEILPDAQAVAKAASPVFLSLLTSQQRHELLWGAQAMAGALERGALLLDTTTGRPEDTVADAQRLDAHGVRLVDVSVSGSSQTVAEGRAVAIIGDTEAGAARYAHLIATFCKAQFCMGAPGQGNRVKLIVNLVMGLNRLVLAEALALAEKGGFDLRVVLDILRAGDSHSVAMDTKGPKMVAGSYEPVAARLAQHAKDVDLILQYAETVGADVPVTALHAEMLRRALERGVGELDNAAIFEAYRLWT